MNDLLGMIARVLWISIGLLLLSCFTYGILCGLFGWNNKLNRPRRKDDDEIIYIEPLDYGDFPEDKIAKALNHKPELPKKHTPHLRIYKPNERKV